MPKRDSLAGYLEIVNISLVDLKESLVMFTNKSFREIIEVLTRLHKENPKVGLLDKLNFYSNQVLYLDKQIEFQLFGFNFMELITGLLMECETKNGNYVETTIEKVITNLEADIKMPKELTAQLRMVLEQNCNYLKEL